MARPSTKPVKLKDGFYIEIRDTGASSGIKIQRETKEQIISAIKAYQKSKVVVYLGMVKDGKLHEQYKVKEILA